MVNTGSTAQHAPNQGRLPIRKAIARYDLLSKNGTHRAPLIEESAGLLRGTILANQKHLRMLQRGAHNWNAWRKANRSVQPDLRDADLSNAHLRDADLSNADLNHAKLIGANLVSADLSNANLNHVSLISAKLIGADLSNANVNNVSLIYADLSSGHLNNGHLSNADLRDADLRDADLRDADLRHADLRDADLRGADVSNAHLSGTNFHEAIIETTTFATTKLSTAHNLETVRHYGPSSIDTHTLVHSEGKIPEVFLRGCGVPESMIEYLPSLLGAMQPIQFYSCFISYSTQNDDFARRLHGRMQQERLRVWFAPEDMKAGAKIHEQIDQAIRMYDKLVLVLSEQSIQSEWVMTEIRKARKAELQDKRRKLFPIRLVDFEVFQTWECHDSMTGADLAEEVRQYFIPDFTDWKNHDAFEATFAKLLRDLKAAA